MDLANHITSFFQKHCIDTSSSSFLVAVSGGVDSMVLLHALQCLDLKLTVAHVNYQLRGEDSELDAKLVKEYCKANGINHHTHHADITSEKGIQEAARTIRYIWFRELVHRNHLDYILTAHHLDDQAETILQKLCRGTGLAGATGIKPVNGKKIRPFLDITKSEIIAYAEDHRVPFRTDASNSKNTYTRNKIRNTIIPDLESINQNTKKHLVQFSHVATQAEALAKAEAKKIWDSNSKSFKTGKQLTLEPWINSEYASLVLHYILADLNIAGSYSGEVFNLCFSNPGKHISTDEFTIWKNRGELIFEPQKEHSRPFTLNLNSEGEYNLPNGKLMLTTEAYKEPLELSSNHIYFPMEKLTWPLHIRPWKAGDSFQPFGMKGTQKVSDLLIQKKIPASQKPTVLVVEHSGKIIWVIGIRSSEETRVSSENNKLLKLLITT